MILTINDNKIDFTLENEKTLKDIVQGIDNWLKSSNMVIEKLYVNKEDFSHSNLDLPIDGINNIDIETVSISEIKTNNINVLLNFLTNFKNVYLNWNKEESTQISYEIKTVYSLISDILSPNNLIPDDIYANGLKEKLEKVDFFGEKLIEGYNDVIPYIDSLIILLSERLSEYTTPYEELKNALDSLEKYNEQLEQVSIYLQTGKEVEASGIMTRFISIFQKVIRLLDINKTNDKIIKKTELETFIKELNDILNELLEGYETQDIVLIGDILEYEITPKIEYLNNLIN